MVNNQPTTELLRRKDKFPNYDVLSERHQSEEELRKAKEQLESFIENTADAIWVVNLDDIVLDVNPSFEQMFGWSAE
ncbi:MAG: PAS domain-containing protein, partial [Bacillota bacterium]|nr:PAS domain-containing protein [Bacillota bacterium]